MAFLGSTTVSGNLRTNGLLSTTNLTVNGNSVTVLSGMIANNTASGALVSAAQVVAYIQSQSVTPSRSGNVVSWGTGWVTSGSSTVPTGTITNNTSGGTSSGTINRGSQIKIGAGYYANDVYYQAQGGVDTPSGNIQLTQSTSTNVSAYATATVRSAATFTMAGTDVTDAATVGSTESSGYYPVSAKIKGTITAGTTGWFTNSGAVQATTATQVGKIAKGTITNNTSGGTSSGTINRGSQIKIGAGWYPSDLYYQAQGGVDTPSGNIQLTQSSSTNVSAYATATVRSASSFTMAGSDVTTAVTVGSTATDGYYPVSAKVKGTVTAGTTGWFTNSGAVQASTATQVGKIAQGVITNNTSGGSSSGTINTSSQIKISAGYYPNDLYYTAAAGIVPSGNIQLTQSSSTDVTNYATATVRGGSATPGATYATLSSAGSSATSVTSQYFKITPTASVGTSGWIGSISDGAVQNYTVRSAATFTMTGSAVTDVVTVGSTESSGYYPVNAKVKGTVAATTTGWFSSSGAVQASSATQVGKIAKGTITNNTSGGTSTATINNGSQIKIGAGYYPSDLYYTAAAGLVPSGNIELTQSSSTDVTNYATATVRSAASFTMTGSAVTDVVTVGSVSNGYYTISAKVKGTITASTTGWFTNSGAVQASTATQVGKIAKGTITNNTSGGTSAGTINIGSQIKIGAGYYPSDSYYTASNTIGGWTVTSSSGNLVFTHS